MEEQVLRKALVEMLGILAERCELVPESRGQIERPGLLVEKWIWTSEKGSRVPSVLYRPALVEGKIPAIVMTCGHGGSKSHWQYTYVTQLYARLGVACLVLDPIGEEERHSAGQMGTRAHDPEHVHCTADAQGRLIMGKLVFDTMRGVDFLESLPWVDSDRMGVAGLSLGGAKAGWMLALDPRLKMALVAGWAFGDILLEYGKFCTRVPNQRLRALCEWTDYLALAAPHCAVLVLNGDADVIIDCDGDGVVWRGTQRVVDEVAKVYATRGGAGKIDCFFEVGGGHRPYHGYKVALEWIHLHLGTPGWTRQQVRALPEINAGQWCDEQGVEIEAFYGTLLNDRGATMVDLGLKAIGRKELACLDKNEIGAKQYTLEGWLEMVGS
ncbi:MAG: alpha/beta hydrolase family protein [Candidatus Latescibacterota bacterium]